MGGEIGREYEIDDKVNDLTTIEDKGVFIEEITALLEKYSLNIPLLAIDEREPGQSIEKIKRLLAGGL